MADGLRRKGCVKGPIQNAPMETNKDTYMKGLYFATRADAEEYIRNRELFVRTIMQQLKEDELEAYDEIIRNMRILYVDAVVGIYNIMVERDGMNRGTSTLPPVFPKNLLNFSKAQFGDLIVA